MITEHANAIKIPDWFIEKYSNIHALIHKISDEEELYFTFPLSTYKEQKFYGDFETEGLFKDIQKILSENILHASLDIILLHECGGVTKVVITPDKIIGMEPTGWKIVEGVEHDYCYGCSDAKLYEKRS